MHSNPARAHSCPARDPFHRSWNCDDTPERKCKTAKNPNELALITSNQRRIEHQQQQLPLVRLSICITAADCNGAEKVCEHFQSSCFRSQKSTRNTRYVQYFSDSWAHSTQSPTFPRPAAGHGQSEPIRGDGWMDRCVARRPPRSAVLQCPTSFG